MYDGELQIISRTFTLGNRNISYNCYGYTLKDESELINWLKMKAEQQLIFWQLWSIIVEPMKILYNDGIG